jgi:IMP dehydrogenase
MKLGLSYDDVLIVPKYSKIKTRTKVDVSATMDKYTKLDVPLIAAPMDTVCGVDMAKALYLNGAIGILHRYNSIEEQVAMFGDVREANAECGVAIGATGDFMDRAEALFTVGCEFFCIDTAHGHHLHVKKAITDLKAIFHNNVHIMAGNVATALACEDLQEWGADSVRVGIGGGSCCSTRIVTGHGVPNFTAVQECAAADTGLTIVADGGIRSSGDAVKALAAGADIVMVGSLLAGTDEAPGKLKRDKKNKSYKELRGMASEKAQKDWRGQASVVEGVSHRVPYKGPVEKIIKDFASGISSGLSYSGVKNIKELQASAEFVRQTGAGTIESRPHILDNGWK